MLYLAAIGRPPSVRKRRPPRLEAHNSLWAVVSTMIGHRDFIMPAASLAAAGVTSLSYRLVTSDGSTALKAGAAVAIGGLTVTLLSMLMSRLQDRHAERRHQEVICMLNDMAKRQDEASSQILTALNDMTERLEAALKRGDDGLAQGEENVP